MKNVLFFTGLCFIILIFCNVDENNPLDLNSEKYVSPSFTIDWNGSNITEDGILLTDSLIIVLSGNTKHNEFRHAIAGNSWSNWTSALNIVLRNIAANTFTLYIQTHYPEGTEVYTDSITITTKIPAYLKQDIIQTSGVQQFDSSFFMHISAIGTLPLTFTWFKNDTAISRAVQDTLLFNALAGSNSGIYYCVVANNWGFDTTEVETVTVSGVPDPPNITTHPKLQEVVNGQSASFTVSASGTAPLNYQWQMDSITIPGSNNSIHPIPSAALADSGALFRCIVSNVAGADTSDAAMLIVTSVVVAPTITGHPQLQTVAVGHPASFNVTASGTMPFIYQWQKGTTDISGEEDSIYTIDTTVLADSGSLFRCIVQNSAGADTSDSAMLKVSIIPAYTVTYLGNGSTGGVVPVDTNSYEAGATVEVLGNSGSLVKTGTTFVGWNTEADGSGTSYAGGVTFSMDSANEILYAQWTTNSTYTVTYSGNGNTGGVVPVDANNYEAGATVTVLGNSGSLVKTGATFVGWNTEADGSGTSYSTDATFAMGSENVTLHARWTTNQTFTVTYFGNGNTGGEVPVDANNYEVDAIVIVKDNSDLLVKTGYVFSAWNTEDDGTGISYDAGNTFTMGSAIVILYAIWDVVNYSITYNLDGGSNDVSNPSSYTVDSSTITFQPATRNGYTFGGWYSDAGFTQSVTTISSGSTGTIVLYAKWTADNYSITYNLNNGTNDVSNPSSYNIESSTITLQPATRDGYTFGGWYSDAGFTQQVTTITSGSTGAVALYAKWTVVDYSITYNLDGGINHLSNPPSYTIDSSTITLQPATKNGYIFGGWYSDAGFTQQVTTIASGSMGAVTLFAKWGWSYTVTFDGQGATVDPNPTSKTVTSPATTVVTLPTDPSKTGYTFGGWYTAINGGGTKFTASTAVTASLPVYAKWTALIYSITYNLDDGDNHPSNPPSYTIESSTITLQSATKTGYIFGGWYSDAGFSQTVTTIASGSSGTVDLFAKWDWSYTITFNGQGATVDPNPTSKTVNSPATTVVTLPTDPSKTGYTFGGWYTATGGGGTQFIASTVVTASIPVYAKWTAVVYSITYTLNGGTNHVSNPASYTIESSTITLQDATRTSYIFDGWYSDAGFTNPVTTIASGSTGTVTLFAKWIIKDIDGNIYTEVTIGTKVWMVENLKVTQCNDGTAIPRVSDYTDWSNLTTPGYCYYNNITSWIDPYGLLYNGWAATQAKLAPVGWHVATDADWTYLETYCGANSGYKLKETGATHWTTPNGDATNEFGFTALPGGLRYNGGSFAGMGENGNWSATSNGALPIIDREIAAANVTPDTRGSVMGFSIRCVRD